MYEEELEMLSNEGGREEEEDIEKTRYRFRFYPTDALQTAFLNFWAKRGRNEGGREEEEDIDFDALPPRKRIGLPDDFNVPDNF